MRDLAKALSNIKIFEYDEDFVAVCDERNGMLSFPLGLVYEAIERAIKAECEVERYKLMVKSITGGLDECMETVHFLEAENDKLRAATTELLEVVEILHPNMNPDEPCVVYEAWEQGKQALAELDKEGGE